MSPAGLGPCARTGFGCGSVLSTLQSWGERSLSSALRSREHGGAICANTWSCEPTIRDRKVWLHFPWAGQGPAAILSQFPHGGNSRFMGAVESAQ